MSVQRLTRCGAMLALPILVSSCLGQNPAEPQGTPIVNNPLPVNWLYGAFVPKDAPLEPLTGEQRFKLYLRQTYTTPGIYIKTGFFVLHDQVNNTQPNGEMGPPALPNASAHFTLRTSFKTH